LDCLFYENGVFYWVLKSVGKIGWRVGEALIGSYGVQAAI